MRKIVFYVSFLVSFFIMGDIQSQPGELEIDCSGISTELLKGTPLLNALYEACPEFSNNINRKAAGKGYVEIQITSYLDGISDMSPNFIYKSSYYVSYRSRLSSKKVPVSPGSHNIQIYCVIKITSNAFSVKHNRLITGQLPEKRLKSYSKGVIVVDNSLGILYDEKKDNVFLTNVSTNSTPIYIESGQKTRVKVFLNNDLEFSFKIIH